MYDEEFGTDWTTLEREEALHRAFALGVAASLGEGLPDEFDRVVAALDSSYDRSLAELAYNKGRGKARRRSTSSDEPERVWRELVVEAEVTEPPAKRSSRGETRLDLPSALGPLPFLDPPQDDLEKLSLPEFVTRD